MDISKQLHAYEVEYHVLQDELQENVNPCDEGEPLEKLERANSHLKRQNMDLLEKLQVRLHLPVGLKTSNLWIGHSCDSANRELFFLNSTQVVGR